MSLHFTTRCPACGTMFRVADDQLKISDGWVRCGHCADVFDAKLYLANWQPPATPDPAGGAAPAATNSPSDWTRTGPETRATPTTDAGARGSVRWVAQTPQTRTAEAPDPASDTPRSPDAGAAPPGPPSDAAPAAAVALLVARWQRLKASAAQRWQAAPASPSEPGFVRQARRRAFWHAPGMRARLSVLALLLTVLLGLQVVVHQRDAIAARHPTWTPALHTLCAPLGCEVAALRRIRAIVIDSSTLLRRQDGVYAFDVVLQNTAPVPLALPALELSLTDSRDAVIARRVFLPQDLPGAPAQLAAQSTVTLRLSLALALGESTPMAGYRALAFYP